VDRPEITETTALGAAYLAGLQVGLFASLDDIASQWRCERAFTPQLTEADRQSRYAGWRSAVARVRSS
jgi:glycerol kinase